MNDALTYADAGVDIDKADDFIRSIKKIVKQTPRSGVMGEIGGFGGLFSLNTEHYERPVLVSSTDGVGTKLKIAFMTGTHDTIGIDLIAMCVNDIIVQGARPLFFLDYLSMGCLDTVVATSVIKGIAEGCRQADCALIGGETAEMPGLYQKNEYDLAGFAVGIADNHKIVDGTGIRVGHKLIGMASSGLHSNGFSLVRKICFDILDLDIDAHIPELDEPLGQVLLTPTIIYASAVRNLLKDLPIHGLAHITGGGLYDNLKRVIPRACDLKIYKDSWETPPVFTFLQKAGNISDKEMMRTFNNGIGMAAVVPQDASHDVLQRLSAMDLKAFLIGEIIEKTESDDSGVWFL
jgi:phosphoribosylformylglycinamidine cyclo-ligase